MRCSLYKSRTGERRGTYRVLVGKSEGRRPLRRPRRRWEDNIKMDVRGVGWVAWTGSIWLRIEIGGGLLWMREWTFGQFIAGNLLTSWRPVSFSERPVLHGVSLVQLVRFISRFCLLDINKLCFPYRALRWTYFRVETKKCRIAEMERVIVHFA